MTSERAARDEYSIEVAQMGTADRLTVAIKRLAARDAEIGRLRAALQQCLRQWKMYSEMAENNEGFDLAKEKSHEADMYRAAYALAHPPA